jgi:rod shape-determining protein MreB
MVVDVGHGLTDAGVLRAGRLIASATAGPGCGDVHAGIAASVERCSGIRLAPRAAEALCRDLPLLRAAPHAPVLLPRRDDAGSAHGRSVPAASVVAAADRAIADLAAHVARFAAALTPQVGCEVIESGILLCGGGALLAARVAGATGIGVRAAAEPLPAVLHGAREVLATLRHGGLARRFALDHELG